MADTERADRASQPDEFVRDTDEPVLIEEMDLDNLPVNARQALLQILRGPDNPRAREAAGRRLYLELERPDVMENFLYTLICDPSAEMRRFAAAMLAHPSLAGHPWVEDWLRHAADEDPDRIVRDRAVMTLRQLAERKTCRVKAVRGLDGA